MTITIPDPAIEGEKPGALVPTRVVSLRALAPGLRTPSGMIGTTIIVIWVVVALSWSLWAQDPFATNALATFRAPSPSHLFGTDSLGRDVFARVMAGSSTSLIIGPSATLIAMAGGILFGGLAGYLGGMADEIIMRIADVLLAFPAMIIAIILLGLLQSDVGSLILLLALFFMPLVARTVRGAVINVKNQEYVEAARLRGESTPYILFAEILPNISGVLVVEATVRLSSAIVTSASLSFIGLGVQPPSPDWGLAIATEAPYLTIAWWAALFPSLALASLVVGVALLAEGLREGSER
ncbi:ABC transporter permease [Subtercola frigoramans]|uniref:Peptide/nickel transport system permease protein n=1 Tax=Subtercola frigoramans TaxID=120298 RepID=A0ABS2L8R3_9MICO|nr:ABC transporter permease [Subtercola frigoramans]MBM7473467.1 peptide/nickel transport system permease protein [Subtercola frigoramans]